MNTGRRGRRGRRVSYTVCSSTSVEVVGRLSACRSSRHDPDTKEKGPGPKNHPSEGSRTRVGGRNSEASGLVQDTSLLLDENRQSVKKCLRSIYFQARLFRCAWRGHGCQGPPPRWTRDTEGPARRQRAPLEAALHVLPLELDEFYASFRCRRRFGFFRRHARIRAPAVTGDDDSRTRRTAFCERIAAETCRAGPRLDLIVVTLYAANIFSS